MAEMPALFFFQSRILNVTLKNEHTLAVRGIFLKLVIDITNLIRTISVFKFHAIRTALSKA